jgi:glycosyltransferase involved in cell wall biosynthesis
VGADKKIAVCHIISGDLWAGADIAMFTVVSALQQCPALSISAILLNNGKLASKLREIGIPATIIGESKNNFFQIIGKTKKVLGRGRIDILHTHRYKENILGGLVKRSSGAKALVQTVHGAGEPFKGVKQFRANMYMKLNRYYSRRYFDRIISVSDDMRKNLAQIYGGSRVVTVHNAINIPEINASRKPSQIRAEFGIDSSAPIIGVAARMVPIKGLEIFLNMAKLIIQKRKDAVFLLVGDGPLKSALEQQSIDIGINNNVIFTGIRYDVIDLMNSFDILVLSSYHEGIPMALLEGIALYRPVVATAVGGITEVIENSVSGLLVKSGDAVALADACLRILDYPDLTVNLVTAAYQKLLGEYSVEIQRQRLLNLYRELIA